MHLETCCLEDIFELRIFPNIQLTVTPSLPPTHIHTHIPCGSSSSDLEVMRVWERSKSLRFSSGMWSRCPKPLSNTFTWLNLSTSIDLQPTANQPAVQCIVIAFWEWILNIVLTVAGVVGLCVVLCIYYSISCVRYYSWFACSWILQYPSRILLVLDITVLLAKWSWILRYSRQHSSGYYGILGLYSFDYYTCILHLSKTANWRDEEA